MRTTRIAKINLLTGQQSNSWFSSLSGRSGSAAISNLGSSFVNFANSAQGKNMNSAASAHIQPGAMPTASTTVSPIVNEGHAEDQGRALEEALQVAKVQGFHMKKCLVRLNWETDNQKGCKQVDGRLETRIYNVG
jgi:hypothetical protein